ncbi:MAG: family 20 glycosylhydrolase, partial [Gemmatimonadota bacterium]
RGVGLAAGAPEGSLGPEGYRLRIDPDSVVLSAGTAAGLFYGLQTLRQLLPPGIDAPQPSGVPLRHPTLPAVEILDAPRFPYRGLHLDVGRHLFPVEFLKRLIDRMALYKLNRFHWHLTEDQGWRIEIERYPRLTGVGAWRKETIFERNFEPYVGDATPYGGYYTQEEARRIVAYAAERHMTVIPEIEMPGHSMAAIAAYPELACTEGPFEVGTRWGVYEEILCPTERTFAFLEGVLTEVMALFPSRWIHVGGDEAPKVRWEESEEAQAVMRREGLDTEEALQGWFIRRIERFLSAHDRRLIGWDEILEGGLAPDAIVMSWRGVEGGIQAARQGHDVIMTPTSHAYFDYYQSEDPGQEPLANGGVLPLERVYAFEPVPDALTPGEARHVLGPQANVWTEYMKTAERVEYMVFPRLLAMAEVAWSPRGARDLDDFLRRLPAQLRRLDALGVAYRIPDVTGVQDRLVLADTLTVTLSAPVAGGEIRYTMDGSEPGDASPRYEAPLRVRPTESGVTLRARVVLPDGRRGAVRTAILRRGRLHAPADLTLESLDPGLRREYFEGEFASVGGLAGADPVRVGTASRVALSGEERADAFGLRLTGYVRVMEDGVYTFALASDDGSRLRIADAVVVDHDGPHGASERTGQIALAAGLHP